jgi:hypothetical protein
MKRLAAVVIIGIALTGCAFSPRRVEYVPTTGGISPEIDAKCRQQEAQVAGNPNGAMAVYDACMTSAGYVLRALAPR